MKRTFYRLDSNDEPNAWVPVDYTASKKEANRRLKDRRAFSTKKHRIVKVQEEIVLSD